MPEPIVNTDTPSVTPEVKEIDWQEKEINNDISVKDTNGTQEPAEDKEPSFDEIFAALLADDTVPEVKKEEPTTPEKEKVETTPETPDTLKEQIKTITAEKAQFEEKAKPIMDALEKNPTLQKLFDAVSSWKLTLPEMFQKFAEAQISKPTKTPVSGTGSTPKTKTMQDTLQDIAAARRSKIDNVTQSPS